MSKENKTSYIILVIVAIVAVVGMFTLMQPKDESTQMGRAVDEIADGFEDAGRELDPNRTPGEKFGDAVEDMGESIQDASEN